MGMISFVRTPRPKQFNYQPVFYDARREALREREQQIKQELGLADDTVPRVSNIKGRFRSQYTRKRAQVKTSNFRLFIIIAILLLLAYFFFYH